MAFFFIKLISSLDTLTKREAAICPPAIITSAEVIIAEYDAILGQWEREDFYNHLSNYIYVGFVIVISPNSKAFLKPFPTLSSCFPLTLGLLHPAFDSQKPETICSHSFPIVPLPSLHFSRPMTLLAPKFDGNACYIMFGKWGYSLDSVASTFPIIVSVRGICIWRSDLAPTLHPWSPINWFDWKWQSGSKVIPVLLPARVFAPKILYSNC